LISDPVSNRILSVEQMLEPENNAITFKTLEKIIPDYKNVDCFILDRCCKVVDQGKTRPLLKQIKFWVLDEWHSLKHTDACVCNPRTHWRLRARTKNYNTSLAEQIFSWFRGYASTLNNMRPLRHRFIVKHYIRLHNDLVLQDDTSHLNKFSKRYTQPMTKEKSGQYRCATTKKNEAKAKKRAVRS